MTSKARTSSPHKVAAYPTQGTMGAYRPEQSSQSTAVVPPDGAHRGQRQSIRIPSEYGSPSSVLPVLKPCNVRIRFVPSYSGRGVT